MLKTSEMAAEFKTIIEWPLFLFIEMYYFLLENVIFFMPVSFVMSFAQDFYTATLLFE